MKTVYKNLYTIWTNDKRKGQNMEDIGVGDIHTHTMYSGFTKYKFLTFPDSVTIPLTSIKVAEKILGLFLQEQVTPGLSAEETIEHIHSQDGIAIAPHLYSAHCFV